MKVSEAIKILEENYEPDDNIIIEWWDYGLFQTEIKEELWDIVVIDAEEKICDNINPEVYCIITETIEKTKKGGY
tara:strand:+ start:598 stop:822 length:225 start_codon:yes stop_codon:yes gene_type:complete